MINFRSESISWDLTLSNSLSGGKYSIHPLHTIVASPAVLVPSSYIDQWSEKDGSAVRYSRTLSKTGRDEDTLNRSQLMEHYIWKKWFWAKLPFVMT